MRRFRLEGVSIFPTGDPRVAVLLGAGGVRLLLAHPTSALQVLKALAPDARIFMYCTISSLVCDNVRKLLLSDRSPCKIGRERLLEMLDSRSREMLDARTAGDFTTLVSRVAALSLQLEMTPASTLAVRLGVVGSSRVWIDSDAELMHTGDERLISAYQRQYVHAAVYLQAGRPRVVEPAFSIAVRGGIHETPVSWPTGTPFQPKSLPRLVAPEAVAGQKRPLPT